ncbi:MAG: endopeptidase La [Thermoflexales bacterium]|nr:endopeptidase La [Thermoflexales bacterium]
MANMDELDFGFDNTYFFRPENVMAAASGVPPEERFVEEEVELPPELAILPLRGVVVYPLTSVPLTVGQPRSVRLVDDAILEKKLIGLIASKKPELEEPSPEDCYTIGTLAAIQRLLRMPDGTIRLIVTGLERIRIDAYTSFTPYLRARVSNAPDLQEETVEMEALRRKVIELFGRLVELSPGIPDELSAMAASIEDPRQLVYAIATYIRIELQDAQEVLEIDDVAGKLRMVVAVLSKELEVMELGRKIQTEAHTEMEKVQREYFLREQLKAIQRELGEQDEQQLEVEEFRAKIEAAGMAEEALKEAKRELDRLSKLPTAAAEYGVIRTYLDWMVSLPWNKTTPDNLDVSHARVVLDEDHYDLADIKERILEYLAVRKLKAERRAPQADVDAERSGADLAEADADADRPQADIDEEPVTDYIRREREGVILCFVGPPGVGKTSLGQSIARALGRKFIRQSLGGVRDEAEIRGFRRTYIGSMPGRILQSLRRIESKNPIFMLDEVDKLGMDFRGDPASALLEVLDPEQNCEFRDHYLDVPFDLSQVMFICTANMLEPIPGPLRDRMEIITLSGYTENEKLHIATGYLLPRQIKENGLRPGEVEFTQAALLQIARDYTREAGVRNMEREMGKACRRVATRIAEGATDKVKIDAGDVEEFLGKPRYYAETAERTTIPGVAIGLVVTPAGGDITFIEATKMPGSKGFVMTGQLGDVMRESGQAALSYVRAKSRELSVPEDFFDKADIHMHVPAGAVPKDGPSAGVTMATALASLLTGRLVRDDLAMTGEITLRGQVLPIGGVKEKILAAHRVGLKMVILPKRNEKDLDDVPQEVRDSMQFVLADSVEQVFEAALRDHEPGQAKPKARTRKNKPIAKGKL